MSCDQLYRITAVVKQLGVKRSTVINAVERGEISAFYTACGLPLVKLPEVQEWTTQERKRGRPRKQ